MGDIDKLFGQIKSVKSGKLPYIVLKGVEDAQFNAKKLFPDSIGNSKKLAKGSAGEETTEIWVEFKTAEAANEAYQSTSLDNIQAYLPKKLQKRKRKLSDGNSPGISPGFSVLLPKPAVTDSPPKIQGWKLIKKIKGLVKKQSRKMLQESKKETDEAIAEVLKREWSFLKASMFQLETGKCILANQEEYFEKYDEGKKVPLIKKTRVDLESEIQLRMAEVVQFIRKTRRDPKRDIARRKVISKSNRVQVFLCQLRGEKVGSVKKADEIKEEDVSEDDDDEEEDKSVLEEENDDENEEDEDDDVDEEQSEEEEEEEEEKPVVAKKKAKLAPKKATAAPKKATAPKKPTAPKKANTNKKQRYFKL